MDNKSTSPSGRSVTPSTSGSMTNTNWTPLLRPRSLPRDKDGKPTFKRQAPQAAQGIVWIKKIKRKDSSGKVRVREQVFWKKKGAAMEYGVIKLFHPKRGSKTDTELTRIDLGRAVISVKIQTKKREFKFDLMDEAYKMKTKLEDWDKWHSAMQQHRLFKEQRYALQRMKLSGTNKRRKKHDSKNSGRITSGVKTKTRNHSKSHTGHSEKQTEKTKESKPYTDVQSPKSPATVDITDNYQKSVLQKLTGERSSTKPESDYTQSELKSNEKTVSIIKPELLLDAKKSKIKDKTDEKIVETKKRASSLPVTPSMMSSKNVLRKPKVKSFEQNDVSISSSESSESTVDTLELDKPYRSILKELPYDRFEPITTLQALCEQMKFSDLITAASNEPDPVNRLCLVAAFAVSIHAKTVYRKKMSLPAIRGETFEMDKRRKCGWRLHSEQVDDHTSVCHVEGDGWTLEQTQTLFYERPENVTFGENLLALEPDCQIHLKIHKFGAEYTWHKVKILLDIKTTGIDMYPYGDIIINTTRNDETRAKITFHKPRHHSDGSLISGQIEKKEDIVSYYLTGSCGQSLYQTWYGIRWIIFESPSSSHYDNEFYGFCSFVKELHKMDNRIPPTDSRLRPDIKLLLDRKMIEAQKLTEQVIEQKVNDHSYKALWFWPPSDTNNNVWTSNATYWESRKIKFKLVKFPHYW